MAIGFPRLVALALLTACLFGCERLVPTGGTRANSTAPAAAGIPQAGRYVIVHSSEVERDTILLDTATGRTWSRVEVGDLTDEPPAWEPMPQLNSNADLAALRDRHPPKDQASTRGWKFTPSRDDPWNLTGQSPAPPSN